MAHHHRSTTKTTHKPFKPRFSSKSALKDQAKGRCKIEERKVERGKRRTPHQQAMSKIARKNQARQLRIHHHEKKELEDKAFQGPNGAPKHVAIIPLSAASNTSLLISQLNESVGINVEIPEAGPARVKVDRFRRNLVYLPSKRNLLDALDICRLADWILLLLRVDQEFDEKTELLLRSIEGQGVTNVAAVVEGPGEKLKGHKAGTDLRASLVRFFPDIERIYSMSNTTDCSNLVRSFCTASTRGIRWRDRRSWMLVEAMDRGALDEAGQCSDVVLSGTIRGRGLNPDRLAHIPGWGDFRIGKLVEAPHTRHKRKVNTVDTMEDIVKEHLPSADQDVLETLAPEVVQQTENKSTATTSEHKGVLLDDHYYFSDDTSHIPPPPRRIPKGTSAYQAAWYLDDVSDSGSDLIDDEDHDGDIAMAAAADTFLDNEPANETLANEDAMTEAGPSEFPGSVMHVDQTLEEETEDLNEFRESRKKEAEEDREFPDEIELHPNVLARERLAKYRGLKSLRTSEWNTEEDAPYEPEEYQRLLKIVNYKKASSQAMREALAGGVPPSTCVEVTLTKVPLALQTYSPTSMFSLLRHEHQHTVVNLNITLNSSVEDPIKSKEELIVQIGPRRLVINPLFSAAGTTPNDVHKFDRFLHPGGSAVATFTGPVTWGVNPILVFKRRSAPPGDPAAASAAPVLDLIGTATTLPLSTHTRIIAKRAILTGHPYKIHKHLVTVRYMFFNRDDVAWFAALPLWTKRGRRGVIKEPLGTHGYFKATFDEGGKVGPMDAVAVSLYKRVWPRGSRAWEGERERDEHGPGKLLNSEMET